MKRTIIAFLHFPPPSRPHKVLAAEQGRLRRWGSAGSSARYVWRNRWHFDGLRQFNRRLNHGNRHRHALGKSAARQPVSGHAAPDRAPTNVPEVQRESISADSRDSEHRHKVGRRSAQ
jgi:hypothetical protein